MNSPLLMGSSPAMIRRIVDFPQPDGPKIDKKSPAETDRVRSLKTVCPSNFFDTSER